MKKIFISVCLLGLFAPGTQAYNYTIPVECAVSAEEGDKLPLQIKKTKKRRVMEDQTGKISFSSPK